MLRRMLGLVLGVSIAGAAAPAQAQAPSATVAAPGGAATAAPAPPPPPYSLPWQLRPAGVSTALRSDTSAAFYTGKDMNGVESSGSTVASTFLGSYKVTPSLAPIVRFAFVRNEEPGETLGSGSSFVSPLVGLTYGRKLPGAFRMSALLAGSIPVGMGGDKKRTMDATAAATFRGIAARSAMDNAMFAVNYFVVVGGADVAFVAKGLTVQAEVTVLQLTRVRNEMVDADSSRTNGTTGLHVGYFVLPWLSAAAEIRYQRWLSTPAIVKMTPAARDTATFALGPRFHFKIGQSTWLRPGISYSRAVDDPLAAGDYQIVQVDLPVIF